MFGPNSAGKSSVIQALRTFRASLDAGSVESVSDGAGIGSFANAVTAHNTTLPMLLGVSVGLDFPLAGAHSRVGRYSVSYVASPTGSRWSGITVGIGDDHARITGPDASLAHVRATRRLATSLVGYHEPVPPFIERIVESFASPVRPRPKRVLDAGWNALRERGHADLGDMPSEERKKVLDAELTVRVRGARVLDLTDEDPSPAPASVDQAVAVARDTLRGVSDRVADLMDRVEYLGPLRPVPERVYSVAGPEDHWSSELVGLAAEPDQLALVNKWLDRLGIPYTVGLREVTYSEHTGVDGIVMTLTDRRSGVTVTPRDVGFGVSQVLPLVVALATRNSRIICIEQPELHLHPALQASLGDLLIEATGALGRRNQVIAETHSEHLLLRVQRRIREGTVNPDDVCVLYVDNVGERGATVQRLHLADDGSFLDEWPHGFFEERLIELFGDE